MTIYIYVERERERHDLKVVDFKHNIPFYIYIYIFVFIFTTIWGNMNHFDDFLSNGFKPPPKYECVFLKSRAFQKPSIPD